MLKPRMRLASIAILTLTLFAQLPASNSSTVHASEGVRALLEGLMEADRMADVATISSFYAEDAALIPPSGPVVHGRAAISERYEKGFRRFRLELSLDSDEIEVSGSLAFSRGRTHGRFIWLNGSEPTPFADKYLMILHKTNSGSWQIHALMWSPERAGE